MQRNNWLRTLALAMMGMWLPAAPAAASYFEWSDGDAQDHDPAYWQPLSGYDNGVCRLTDDGYTLTPYGVNEMIASQEGDHVVGPTRITTQIHLTGSLNYAGVWARGTLGGGNYWVVIHKNESLYVGEEGLGILKSVPTDLSPLQQDVILQFQVYDDYVDDGRRQGDTAVLKAWAWSEGESKPAEPTIEHHSSLVVPYWPEGPLGLFTLAFSLVSDKDIAYFRWIEVLTLGDMDGNDALDAFDVDGFELALSDKPTFIASHPDIDPNIMGDLNGDGAFDAFDVKYFELSLAHAGSYTGLAPTVPEPATITLLTMGGLMMLRRRK